MIDFIDKTSEENGTPINRKNLMAMQGFISREFYFMPNGSVVEENSNGEKLTTKFNPDGSITETFVGEKTITKTTRFDGNRISLEVLS